jgi:hypothetical protein
MQYSENDSERKQYVIWKLFEHIEEVNEYW